MDSTLCHTGQKKSQLKLLSLLIRETLQEKGLNQQDTSTQKEMGQATNVSFKALPEGLKLLCERRNKTMLWPKTSQLHQVEIRSLLCVSEGRQGLSKTFFTPTFDNMCSLMS